MDFDAVKKVSPSFPNNVGMLEKKQKKYSPCSEKKCMQQIIVLIPSLKIITAH